MLPIRGYILSTFAEQKSGFTRFTVALTQNVWTRLTTQCPHRKSISFIPTNPAFVVMGGLDAPSVNPTLPTQYDSNANKFNEAFNPAMTKAPFWGFTSVAGVSVIVEEELDHCGCEDDYNSK